MYIYCQISRTSFSATTFINNFTISAAAAATASTVSASATPCPPSVARRLCLRCAKHLASDPSCICSYNQEGSNKCFCYCGLKAKCLSVSFPSFRLQLSFVLTSKRFRPASPVEAIFSCAMCACCRSTPAPPLVRTPFGEPSSELLQSSRTFRKPCFASRPFQKERRQSLWPSFGRLRKPTPFLRSWLDCSGWR